jgi:predicted aldo/keto reductase-like oxidoreductase
VGYYCRQCPSQITIRNNLRYSKPAKMVARTMEFQVVRLLFRENNNVCSDNEEPHAVVHVDMHININ